LQDFELNIRGGELLIWPTPNHKKIIQRLQPRETPSYHKWCARFWPEWTSTHQSTNVDGWCTDGYTFLVLPCPWLTKVANSSWLFFPFLSLGWFFWEFFFSSPRTPVQASPSYLHLDYLPMHLGVLPPPPAYLHAHLPTHLFTYSLICLPTHPKSNYLCTYALNLH